MATVKFYKTDSAAKTGGSTDLYTTFSSVPAYSFLVPPALGNNIVKSEDGRTISMLVDWIDVNTGKSAKLNCVSTNINCYPTYFLFSTKSISNSNVSTNLISFTKVLQDYLQQVLYSKCSNIGSYQVSSKFYKIGYLTLYSNNATGNRPAEAKRIIEMKATNKYDDYLNVVSLSTLKNDINIYFLKIKEELSKRFKLISTEIVIAYYSAAVYFIQNSIVYVHSMFDTSDGTSSNDSYAFYKTNKKLNPSIAISANYHEVIVLQAIKDNIVDIAYSMKLKK